MKKLSASLAILALVGAGSLATYLLLLDRGDAEGTAAAPARPLSPQGSERDAQLASPVAPGARPEDAQAPPPSRSTLDTAPEAERYGEWGEAQPRWIEGTVATPAGVPADETLRVLALSRPMSLREIYGERGLLQRLETKGPDAAGADLYAVESVDLDGSFRLPFPDTVEHGWIAVDGRYLFSERPESASLAGEEIRLEPSVGAYVVGQVSLPPTVGQPTEILADLQVELGPDSNQFSMLDAESEFLFDRGASVDADGRFELRAVDVDRPYELQIESDLLADYRLDGILLEEARRHEFKAELLLGARVLGRVLDAGGQAIGEAEVSAVTTIMWGFPGDTLAETRAASDGRFELTGVPPGKATIVARADGLLESSPLALELENESSAEGVELVLEDGNSIEGVVLWEDGGPVAGAQVEVSFDPAAMMGMTAMNMARGANGTADADEDGRFRVVGLGKGPFLVEASSPEPMKEEEQALRALGYIDSEDDAAWKASVAAIPPNTSGLELRLRPPSELHGRVVDLAGEPVTAFRLAANSAGAVFFMPGESRTESVEHPEGRFVLRNLDEGPWELVVRAPGFGPSTPLELLLPDGVGDEPLVIVMQPESGVTGTVLDPTGNPLPGAKVTVQVETQKAFARITGRLELPETHADEEGAFYLSGLGVGTQGIYAKHPEYAVSEVSTVELEAGTVAKDMVLRLRRGGLLTGEVFDQEGDPMRGGQVFVQDTSTWETITLRTGEDGWFELENLRPGSWQVTAMLGAVDPGASVEGDDGDMSSFFTNMRFTVADVKDGEETHIVLGAPPEDPVVLRGHVTHAGEPVKQAMLSFFPDGGEGFSAMKMDQVDSEGAFEVALDQPGTYVATVQLFGSGAMQQSNVEFRIDIPETEEHTQDFELPVGRISGVVFGPDGDPLGGARVTLTADGGVAYGTFMGGQYAEVAADAGGAYDLDFLRPGTYSVAAGGSMLGGVFGDHRAEGRIVMSGIELGEGQHRDGVDFRLSTAGDITGRVVDHSGQPVKGATIFVRDASGNLLERFSMIATGPDGSFKYTGVAPGEYAVTARTSEGATPDDILVEVREGAVTKADLTLSAGTILLVQAIDQSGADLEATLSVVDGQGRELTGMIGYSEIMESLGRGFSTSEQRVGPLPPGSYTVVAVARDGRRARKPVTLSGQPERRLKVRLK